MKNRTKLKHIDVILSNNNVVDDIDYREMLELSIKDLEKLAEEHSSRSKIISFFCPKCHNKTFYDVDTEVKNKIDVDYDDLFICEECGFEAFFTGLFE